MKKLGFILALISSTVFAEQISSDTLQALKLQCQMDSNCEIEYFNKRKNQQKPVTQFTISNDHKTLYIYEADNGYIDVSTSLEEQVKSQQMIQQQQN